MEENLQLILDEAPVGILTFDSEFKVTRLNRSLKKFGILYRLNFKDLEGSDLSANDILNISAELSELKTGVPFEKILHIPSTSGKKKIVLVVKAVPLLSENNFAGGILILEDLNVSEKPLQEDKIKSSDLEFALNNLNNFLFITDENGIIKFSYGKDLFKLTSSEKEINGSDITDFFPESAKTNINEQLKIARDKRLPSTLTLELRAGNELFVYECHIEPLINEKGKVQLVFFVFNEVSQYLSSAAKLENENKELQQFRSLLEETADGMLTLNLDGNIIFWNNAAVKLFGSTRDEVLNTFFGGEAGISKDYFEIIKEKLNLSGTWETTLSFNNRHGERKIVSTKWHMSKTGTIFLICTDITDRSLAEEVLSKSEERFRNISVNTGAAVLNVNPEGIIIYVNPAFLEKLHLREAEVLHKNINNFLDPASPFPSADILQGDKFNLFDLSFTGRRGRIYLRMHINVVFKSGETPLYFNCVGIDFTPLRIKEKELDLFRSLFEASKDGMALEKGRYITAANSSFASIFGFSSPGELVNKDILDLISSNDILKAAEYFQPDNKIVESFRLEFMGKKKDGSTMFSEFTVSSFSTDNNNYRLIIARDVTDRKKAQQSIRESEEKYRNITDNIDDFLYTFETKGTTLTPTFYTNSVEKVTGYKPAEFIKDSKLFLKIVHPDDFAVVKKKLKNLFKSRLQLTEEFEFRIINKHGNIVWVRNKINIIRNGERKIQRIYGLVSDISLRKRAEDDLKVSTTNLVKVNETKDKFISIISHDLRTPFSSILGFTDLLLNDEGLSENEKKQYISFIGESSRSMLALVNSLLDWTRLQTGHVRFEPDRSDASLIIGGSMNALKGVAFQKNIQLFSSVQNDVFVFVDFSMITQVFNNLISNAIKFTNKGGRIEISSKPSEQIRFIEFVVKDNGVGIPPSNLNKLFTVESKFTSEGTAGERGTGLGLSLVKEIIEKHGGRIWVNSTPGEGSQFHFTLPVAPAMILLVDDSKTDKLLYSKILKNITPDYNIQIASDGKEAFEIIKKTPPALVISDHLMPVMDGLQFVQTLKNSDIKGKPPVIILSSELDRHIIQDYTELGIEYVFQKPVNLIHFKQAVEKSLRKGLS